VLEGGISDIYKRPTACILATVLPKRMNSMDGKLSAALLDNML